MGNPRSDLCFITETPMDDVIAHLAAEDVPIITGPGERSGATGTLLSVYVYDPDENLIEIANLLLCPMLRKALMICCLFKSAAPSIRIIHPATPIMGIHSRYVTRHTGLC